MKFIGSGLLLFCFIYICAKVSSIQAAAIICDDESLLSKPQAAAAAAATTNAAALSTKSNDNTSNVYIETMQKQPDTATATTTGSTNVKQFLQTVQCTLEKAKPWVEEIEQEAKRFEETAKRVGAGIINKFGDLMESWMHQNANNTSTTTATSTAISLLSGLLGNVAPNPNTQSTANVPTITNTDAANVAIVENVAV